VSRDKSILGLHTDDDFLNIVLLGQTANGLHVHSWAAESLKAGVVKDGLIVDEQTVSQIICDFIKTNQPKPSKAIMSLSCSAVRLRPSEFPAQTDEQLQEQVKDQVGKYALFGGQEVVFGYCVFQEMAQSSNKLTVLHAVTTREVSDACLAVARKAKLDLVRIEPAILPVIKLTYDKLSAGSDTVCLLLALDSVSGNISVFQNGLPQFCQNLSTGIREISQDKDGLTRLINQLKPVLEFVRSLASSQQLMLSVATSCSSENMEAIFSEIEQSLSNVAVEQIDPSQIAKQFGVQGADGSDVPIFALSSALTAFGVCELDEQLNLVSQESLTMQKTQREISLTAKAIVAVVLLSIAAIVPLKMKIKSVEAASANIEAKLTETVPIRQKITDIKRQITRLEEKQSTYAADSQKLTDIPWPQALQVIGDTVPDEVRIVGISTTDLTDFTLVGEALAESYIYRFAKRLQDDELIESAKVEKIEYDNNSTKTLVDYKITCKIRLSESDL